jgi:acylpyruvate hydrolase
LRLVSFRRLEQTRIGVIHGDKVIDLNRAYRACLESACEPIPRGLPRGKRAKNGFVPLKDRRFSAACCGELQSVGERIDPGEADRTVPAEMKDFLAGGAKTMAAARRALAFLEGWMAAPGRPPADSSGAICFFREEVKLLSPIPRPGKIICIGLNYPGAVDAPRPEYPVIFLKAASSVIGSGETVYLPRLSRQIFTEAELAVVIGSRAKHLTPEKALSCVAGYTMGNDLGASDLENRTSQWTTGKLMDTFCPLGPSLLTADELTETNNLAMTTRINGRTVQRGNTREMIFAVPFLVSYVSELATLEPGDVILTGSPKMMNGEPAPVVFLKHGDVVEVEIGGLGILRNPVADEPMERR